MSEFTFRKLAESYDSWPDECMPGCLPTEYQIYYCGAHILVLIDAINRSTGSWVRLLPEVSASPDAAVQDVGFTVMNVIAHSNPDEIIDDGGRSLASILVCLATLIDAVPLNIFDSGCSMRRKALKVSEELANRLF